MKPFYPLFALALTACGGGGGGAGGGSQTPVPFTFNIPAFSSAPPNDAAYSTQTLPIPNDMEAITQVEYGNTSHLATIKADAAYRQGLSGKGITLGMLDRPIQLDHPEFCHSEENEFSLDDNCDKAINYDHRSLFDNTDGFDASISHGTAVASVMTGAYNRAATSTSPGGGMMGVAYNANLIVFGIRINVATQVESQQDPPPDPINPIDELRKQNNDLAFIYSAVNRIGVDVVNASFGILFSAHEYTKRDLETHYSLALSAFSSNRRTVYVYAAGNSNKESPSVTAAFPAYFPAMQDRVLVVVNDTVGQTNDQSNKCGVAKDFCLAAPGVAVRTAANNDGYQDANGTSFAAPQVTGAMGLLLEGFASQNMTPQQARTRLLDTADKTFSTYDEDLHGQGRLDIEAALQPTGMSSLRTANGTPNGNALPLLSSTLTLPAPFGDALQHSGHHLTFFDSLDTAFLTPLSHHIRSRFTSTLDTILATTTTDSIVSRETIAAKKSNVSRETISAENSPNNWNVSRETIASAVTGNPYFTLLNQRSFNHSLSTPHKAFNMVFSAVAPSGDNQQNNQWGVALRTKLTPAITADMGYADEGNQLLSGYGRAGFAFQPRHTLYSNIDGRYSLGARTDLWLRAFMSHSRAAPQPHSLIRGLTPILSTAFDVRLTHHKVLTDNDKISLHVKQPLKVEDGAMTLHYATWRDASQLLYGRQTLSLTPTSRALHFGVNYATPLPMTRSHLTLTSAYIVSPNHSQRSQNEWLGALQLYVPF